MTFLQLEYSSGDGFGRFVNHNCLLFSHPNVIMIGSRYKQKKSQSSQRKSKSNLQRCNLIHEDSRAFVELNRIRWDIQYPFEKNLFAHLLNTKTKWCQGEIKLLMPISKSTDDTSMMIYYQETIRKRNVTVGDVISRIDKFYNNTKVLLEDFKYVSVSENMRDFAETSIGKHSIGDLSVDDIRFADFLRGSTTFVGLQHQMKNIYSVKFD